MQRTVPQRVSSGLPLAFGLILGVYAWPAASAAYTVAAASAPGASASSAVASSDGERPGVRVEVTELKRSSSGTISLKFTIINDSDRKMGFGYDFADDSHHIKDHGSVGGVTLLDPVGKKKYFVVRDSDTACVCSRDVRDIDPKSRANLWAKFPAPPQDVKKISIVIPHFAPMDDVPISQ